jgi:hypothetical protein
VLDLKLYKKEAELLGSRQKRWNLLHQDTDLRLFAIAKMNPKNFSLKKNFWYFVMMFALL